MTSTRLRGNHRIYYYDYPTGNRAFGGGGWSSKAKSRPAPMLVIKETLNPEIKGKSVLFDGVRKLKCTIVRSRDGAILREDYPIQRITQELLTRTGSFPINIESPEPSTQHPFGGIHRKITK
jgi:hypothetical protein